MILNIIIETLKERGAQDFMKRTYQPNKRKKAKTHGFFARKGTKTLNNRRRKGRKELVK